LVGLKALGVRQVRHAEQVDLVHHDQGGPPPPSDRTCMTRCTGNWHYRPFPRCACTRPRGRLFIQHAAAHPLVVVDVDPDADPPKLLVIGPDRAGNLLEVVMLTLADDRVLVIHAMPLRRVYYDLLPEGGDADA